MTTDDMIAIFSAGLCHPGEKRDDCHICQRRLAAIERVRRAEAVIAAARIGAAKARAALGCDGPDARELVREAVIALGDALDAYDGGTDG